MHEFPDLHVIQSIHDVHYYPSFEMQVILGITLMISSVVMDDLVVMTPTVNVSHWPSHVYFIIPIARHRGNAMAVNI